MIGACSFACVCVCLFDCLSLSVCVCLSVCMCLSVSVSVSVWVFLFLGGVIKIDEGTHFQCVYFFMPYTDLSSPGVFRRLTLLLLYFIHWNLIHRVSMMINRQRLRHWHCNKQAANHSESALTKFIDIQICTEAHWIMQPWLFFGSAFLHYTHPYQA